MLQSEMRIIDGKEFTVTPFSFFVARNMERKVLKIALPVLAQVTGSFKGVSKDNIDSIAMIDSKIDGLALSEAIETLFNNISEKEYIELLTSIFANTQVGFENDEGKRIDIALTTDMNFTIAFGREVITMYKAIAYVAEVNFPDYFGKASVIGQKISSIATSFLAKNTQIN